MDNDRFEQFVRDHREEFDFRDPDSRIWDRVGSRIAKYKKYDWRLILKRAAVVALIFAASYGVNEWFHQVHSRNLAIRHAGTNMDSRIPGLKETEAYYSSLVNQKMDELKPIMANCPSLQQELNTDMSELDSVYADLKNDLKDNMANQEVIEAIIENYKLKINILENVLAEIKDHEHDCLPKKNGDAL
jgi:hypothetical protein